jgi:acyl-CoA synthetase (AMP-forming)/AMP-acid ligase II
MNTSDIVFKKRSSVSAEFDRIVKKFSSSAALQNYPQNDTFSYKHLQEQATLVAKCIMIILNKREGEGVKNNCGVVLCVEEGPEMVILILALAYAGLFYVPVELSKTPPQRVAFIANDCGAEICIAWNSDKDRLPESIPFVAVEQLFSCANKDNDQSQKCFSLEEVSPSTSLYAIYTSGSTGEPKGVMMNHSNLVIYSEMKGSDEKITHADESRVLLASAFTFDLCQVGVLYISLAVFFIYFYVLCSPQQINIILKVR